MRNVRSYLVDSEIPHVQPQAYYRLKNTTGSTYGSGYKRRYGSMKGSIQTQAQDSNGQAEQDNYDDVSSTVEVADQVAERKSESVAA